MKGVRFYEEFDNKANKRKGVSSGNVIALFYDSWRVGEPHQGRLTEAIAAIFCRPNSRVAPISVADTVLWERCKRISEAEARVIHPALFERLDAEE